MIDKRFRRAGTALLVLTLAVTLAAQAGAQGHTGDVAADFTLTSSDDTPTTYTLSEVLADGNVVLLFMAGYA